jgi:hypothetical protein
MDYLRENGGHRESHEVQNIGIGCHRCRRVREEVDESLPAMRSARCQLA